MLAFFMLAKIAIKLFKTIIVKIDLDAPVP
jgi:hypothetical protein